MKKLFYLFVLAGLLSFVGCSSSNSGAGKFLGKWEHFNTFIKDTVMLNISRGEGDTYDILWYRKGQGHYTHPTKESFKGFKYDPDKDILYRDKGSLMEIVYNEDSSTVRIYENNMPDEISYKKVNN